MERLTSRNERGDLLLCGEYVYGNNQNVYNAISLLEEYEDLKEQDILIKLPCKVGSTVYIANYDTHTITEGEVWKIGIHKAAIMLHIYIGNRIEEVINMNNFGKTAFLTRAEAERALKEVEK